MDKMYIEYLKEKDRKERERLENYINTFLSIDESRDVLRVEHEEQGERTKSTLQQTAYTQPLPSFLDTWEKGKSALDCIIKNKKDAPESANQNQQLNYIKINKKVKELLWN